MAARAKRNGLTRENKPFQFLPKQILSLPATIYFTNNSSLPPQAFAAALLDLVRQGYVNKTSTHLKLTGRKSTLTHENVLMEWLFKKIGTDQTFSFKDLTSYTKNKKNHTQYHLFQSEWKAAVKQEVESHSLYEKKTVYRLIIGLSSLLLLPFLFLFLMYDLIGSFLALIPLIITVIIYAIAYRPKTWEGAKMVLDWKNFRTRFKDIPQTEWETWSEDDRMRAYIYGLGMNDDDIANKNEDLVEAFIPPSNPYDDSANFYTITYLGPNASSNFRSAYHSTGSTSSGGSFSSSSGGGTGGGGGGSGAF